MVRGEQRSAVCAKHLKCLFSLVLSGMHRQKHGARDKEGVCHSLLLCSALV